MTFGGIVVVYCVFVFILLFVLAFLIAGWISGDVTITKDKR